jgi:hypothetical protein
MCARKDGAIPGQRRDALRFSGYLGRKQTTSLSPSLESKNGSFFLLTPCLHIQPVVRLEGKLCVFPGIPSLFQKMLDGLKTFLPLPPLSTRPFRHQIFTPWVSKHKFIYPWHPAHLHLMYAMCCVPCSLPESSIAPYLTELQKRVKEEGIRVGSYPFLMKGVFVSLIGQDEVRVRELGKEVEGQTQGRAVTEQEIRETKRSVSL